MKITKISINNFRNIPNAEYELGNLNVFTGANKKGKTNTILAVYWALADCLFDGSSDYASFKPIGNESETVSVELEFDNNFKFKKSFEENWVKTRGTDEKVMQGHITSYEINDTKYKTNKEAIEVITKSLGLSDVKVSSKINLARMLIDPYYLASGLEWKVLRELIIDLIGDVSNEDVLFTDSSFNSIKERLEKDKFNTDTTNKFYKQQVKTCKEQIESIENQVKGLQSMMDVTDTALQDATKNIEDIDKLVVSMQSNNSNEALLNSITSRLNDAKAKLNNSIESDRKNSDELNANIHEQIKLINEEVEHLNQEIKVLVADKVSNESKLSNSITTQNQINIELSRLLNEREKKLQKYHDVESSEFIPVPVPNDITCPHCGCAINQDLIDELTQKNEDGLKIFIENKTKELASIISVGKELAAQIKNEELKLEEIKKVDTEYSAKVKEVKEQISALESQRDDKQDKITQLNKTLKMYEESSATQLLKIEVDKVQQELNEAKNSTSSADILLKIGELKSQKQLHHNVINEHIAFEQAQLKIKDLESQILRTSDEQTTFETYSL
ncbi:MAG: hypothetical protein RR623_10365, partial [Bacilli bacterium]